MMRIRWTKSDGMGRPDSLACFRDDGTTSHTRLHPYFPLHDLMHYAVETTLGYSTAFWGLVQSGWEFQTFEQKDPATGKIAHGLPEGALRAENLVGILQLVETGSVSSDPDELRVCLTAQWDPVPEEITADNLAAARALFATLRDTWRRLPPGDAMELHFPTPDSSEGDT